MGLWDRIKTLKEKIIWDVEYAWNKKNAEYCMEFISRPIKNDSFKQIAAAYITQGKGEIDKITSFELPQSVIKHNSVVLLASLPSYKNKAGHKLLTKEITKVKYERVAEGWVITMVVEGIRRVF